MHEKSLVTQYVLLSLQANPCIGSNTTVVDILKGTEHYIPCDGSLNSTFPWTVSRHIQGVVVKGVPTQYPNVHLSKKLSMNSVSVLTLNLKFELKCFDMHISKEIKTDRKQAKNKNRYPNRLSKLIWGQKHEKSAKEISKKL